MRSRARWLTRATDWIPDLIRTKEGEVQRGVGRGLKVNGGGSATGFLLGTHDPRIQVALAGLVTKGMVAYDIGANVGFTSIIAARLTGPQGTVICFEPQPDCARLARHNAELNDFKHVVVREEALDNRDGQARFLVSRNSTFSRLATSGQVDLREEIDVRVSRLDTLIAEGALPRPGLLKIDVEGGEVALLEGAQETLRTVKPIVLIELHHTNVEVHAALTAAGYELRLVGSRDPVQTGHWNSLVVGVPAERSDLVALAERLTDPRLVDDLA